MWITINNAQSTHHRSCTHQTVLVKQPSLNILAPMYRRGQGNTFECMMLMARNKQLHPRYLWWYRNQVSWKARRSRHQYQRQGAPEFRPGDQINVTAAVLQQCGYSNKIPMSLGICQQISIRRAVITPRTNGVEHAHLTECMRYRLREW